MNTNSNQEEEEVCIFYILFHKNLGNLIDIYVRLCCYCAMLPNFGLCWVMYIAAGKERTNQEKTKI